MRRTENAYKNAVIAVFARGTAFFLSGKKYRMVFCARFLGSDSDIRTAEYKESQKAV